METFALVTVRLVRTSTVDNKGAWRLEIWEQGCAAFSTLIELGNEELSRLLAGLDLDLVAKKLILTADPTPPAGERDDGR